MKRQRQIVSVYIVLAAVVVIALVLALASGGGGGARLVTDYPPIIPDTTKVLSAATTQYLTSISPDQVVYTFAQTTSELDSLKAGDIMVSDVTSLAPDGFLRKVTKVTYSGRQVVVETAPAALTEAVQSGTIRLSQKLTPADVVSAVQVGGASYKLASLVRLKDEFFIQVKDVVIYDDDGNFQTAAD